MDRLRTALGLVLAVGLAAPARADVAAEAKPVTVPFELLKTKHMTVQIKVNGRGPYRVIFDTGAPVSIVSTQLAGDSGLAPKQKKQQGLLGMLMAGGQAITIKKLQVGKLTAEDVPVIVMDHPAVELLSEALGRVDGIIGFPFFARYKMTLDYQAKQMTFVPNGYEPPDVIASLMSTMMSLMGSRDKPPPKVLAPAALWGLVVAKEAGDEEAGVTVKEVHAGSAAAEAGLKPGDRLLVLDTRWTDTLADTYAAAGFVKPGTTVTVRVKRDGKEIDLTVKPAAGL